MLLSLLLHGFKIQQMIVPLAIRFTARWVLSTPLGEKLKIFASMVFQTVIGTTFTTMGVATMFFPVTATRLGITSKFLGVTLINRGKEWDLHPALKFTVRCFGAQASLCGLLLLSTRMEKFGYQVFSAAIVPFLIFNVIGWRKGIFTTLGAVADGLGNIIFLVGSWFAIRDL
jgi:hypothetical protein